jgi:hypothetical protein
MGAEARKASPGRSDRRAAGLLAVALLFALVPWATAHRGHAVWTDIRWAGESFEIVHRLHLADAITIQRYMGVAGPIEDLRGQAAVALYVEKRFVLLLGNERVTPTTIGAEIEDDFLLVYQEWVTALPERFPRIDNSLLLDVEPGAQAFVHIEGPGISEERERT